MTARPLSRMLKSRTPILLDGAMGTELRRHGASVRGPLWSARALLERPELVVRIHTDYIAAGADIITTCTFRTTGRSFRRARLPDRSAETTALAVRLAHLARAAAGHGPILIAGSMGPLEDCYRPDLVPPTRELEAEHREQARRLAPECDFLLIETIGTVREAVCAARAAHETGRELVISFLCDRTGNLYGGESLSRALVRVEPFHPAAVSVNCTSARATANALALLARSTAIPLAAYANAGTPGNQRGKLLRVEVDEEEYAWCALEWLTLGARMIGGCCGTTPAYIRHLAQHFGRTPVDPSSRKSGRPR